MESDNEEASPLPVTVRGGDHTGPPRASGGRPGDMYGEVEPRFYGGLIMYSTSEQTLLPLADSFNEHSCSVCVCV